MSADDVAVTSCDSAVPSPPSKKFVPPTVLPTDSWYLVTRSPTLQVNCCWLAASLAPDAGLTSADASEGAGAGSGGGGTGG